MFGMGGSEIIVILIVALLFLGPDKLPSAAKSISKGIRDIKKQSRALQQQIESDEQIGGAIRDLKSALRGEDAPYKAKPYKPSPVETTALGDGAAPALAEGTIDTAAAGGTIAVGASLAEPGAIATAEPETVAATTAAAAPAAAAPANGAAGEPRVTLPAMAGEADPVAEPGGDEELASLIKPAPGTVAKGS